MFQSIQQFHPGGWNTNSFMQAFIATLFIIKSSIDMRILSTELSQLKRIAIINAISNCVCKGCPYRCKISKFNILAKSFLVTAKLIKKGYPFSSCRYESQLIKRVRFFIFFVNATPFSTLQRNFYLQKSFHKPIFDILNRLDIDKKRSQNQSITVW